MTNYGDLFANKTHLHQTAATIVHNIAMKIRANRQLFRRVIILTSLLVVLCVLMFYLYYPEINAVRQAKREFKEEPQLYLVPSGRKQITPTACKGSLFDSVEFKDYIVDVFVIPEFVSLVADYSRENALYLKHKSGGRILIIGGLPRGDEWPLSADSILLSDAGNETLEFIGAYKMNTNKEILHSVFSSTPKNLSIRSSFPDILFQVILLRIKREFVPKNASGIVEISTHNGLYGYQLGNHELGDKSVIYELMNADDMRLKLIFHAFAHNDMDCFIAKIKSRPIDDGVFN